MPQPMDFTPKEPQKEVGRQARQQYLQFAQRIIDEPTMDYTTIHALHRCLRESLIVAKQKIDADKNDDPVEFLLGRTLS